MGIIRIYSFYITLKMLHKHNANKCHHISKAKYAITNWPQYETGLKQRGRLTLWVTREAIAQWKAASRTTTGGQARYSDLAIQTCLMLRTAFWIPLRQAEGLMAAVFGMMNLSLSVPDHTTVSCRATVLPPLPPLSSQGDVHVLILSAGRLKPPNIRWVEEIPTLPYPCTNAH